MTYFAVFSPMLDEDKSKLYRPNHLDFIKKQLEDGHVFAKGRFTDGAGGLVIYQANSLAEAEGIVKQDPYVVKGARGFEIHEWEMTQS